MANYLYNGVEFPDINEVWTDKETYPYAYIAVYDYGTRLYLSKTVDFAIVQIDNGFDGGISYGWRLKATGVEIYQLNSLGDGWSLSSSNITYANSSIDMVKWANFDVISQDGSVYLAASEPIPVGQHIAVYMDIGGVRKKVTAYQDIGGVRRKISEAGASLPAVGTSLEDCTWEQISAISAAGKAAEYFSVGDTKSVHLEGTVGTLELDTTLYVYILGFDHNSEVEGKGIHFGTFKTADGVDVALIDSEYEKNDRNGTKYFNMNHWGNYNYGGWAGCDMRYDILGSTDKAPSGYGAAKTTSVVGYDPSSTCATTPVAGTLMAALPADLRAVMKPMTKYTNNTGNLGDTEEKVTVTTDYLPLLAEFEIFGERKYANSYEQNKQKQYDYFAAGNSKKKYRHSSTGSSANWWERSARYDKDDYFCYANVNGYFNSNFAYFSYGVAPAFKV